MGSQATDTAAYVRQRRKAKEWTQFRLAAEAGVSLKTIEMLERGETRPHASTLAAIDRALDEKAAA